MKMIALVTALALCMVACQHENKAVSQPTQTAAAANNAPATNGAGIKPPKKAWELDNLKGNVKKITENRYHASEKDGKVVQGSKLQEENDLSNTYNEKGNIIENIRSDFKTKKIIKQVYIYNDQDLLVETKVFEITKNFTTSEKLKTRYELKYNDQGLNTETRTIFNDTLREITTAVFDKKGNKTQEDKKKPDTDELFAHSVYGYDDYGNVIETQNFDKKNTLFNKGMFSFNQKGQQTEEIWEYPQQKATITKKIYYDANGNINKLDNKIQGNNPKGDTLQEFKYEFDDKGNWIKQIMILNGKVEGMSLRTIEYFD
ncbi:MAG: hypothetical protein JNM36_09335 [Chitinophagales bacterium]|jgi:hypothetical protein|nr:hypothetical protein [Chitinophagales bacterium]